MMNTPFLAGSAYTLLGVFLALYMVTTAIDVGGGAIALWARWRGADGEIGESILHYVSPVWEVSNVFLIAFFVGTVGFFPGSVGVLGGVLFVPLANALLLMLVRGLAFTWFYYVNRRSWAAQGIAAVAGLLVPALLVPYLTASDLAGRLGAAGSQALLYQPLTLALMLVAVTSVVFIAATFLAWYAARAGEAPVAAYLRRVALWAAGPTIGAALLTGMALHLSAPAHAASAAHWWPLLALVGGLFTVQLVWLWRGVHAGWAFVAAACEVGLSLAAWLAGQWPYLVRPALRATDALVNGPMYTALAITLAIGLALLLPLLGLFYYLFVIRWSGPPTTEHATGG